MMPRKEQQRYAAALVSLLAHDLPEAVWTVGGNEGLVGHIPTYSAGPGPRRAHLRTWAEFLNAEISVTRYGSATGGSADVVGEFAGVPVRVWSPFTKSELPKTPETGS
jgi:hypothetical protein